MLPDILASMTERRKFILTGIKYTGITLVVFAVLKWLLILVIPFLIAFLLAKWLHPLAVKLQKRWKGAGGVLLIILFALIALGIGLLIWGIAASCQQVWQERDAIGGQLMAIWDECCCRIADATGFEGIDQMGDFLQAKMPDLGNKIEQAAMKRVMNWSAKSMKGFFSACGIALAAIVSSFLILRDYAQIKSRIRKSQWGNWFLNIGSVVLHTCGTYIKTQVVVMGIIGAVCVGILALCKNPYAVPIGIAIGICDALPFIGTGMVFVPWALVDLLRGEYLLACVYAGAFALCTFLREILEPRIMGNGLSVHPVAVMVSLYVGICVYGLPGVILGPVSLVLIREIGRSSYFSVLDN